MIGQIVKLKVALLGNPKGTIGICYDHYTLGNRDGKSYIFQNGEYDGFSPDEQEEFLEVIGQSSEHSNYNFTNVMQLTRHFNNGYWNSILK